MAKKDCQVENCQKKVLAKDYCQKHYHQIRKYGKIFERTIYDLNDFIEYDDYFGIILRNKNGENIAETLIDKIDYKWAINYKWRLLSSGYAATSINGKTKCLHKLILLEAKQVDHRNRNSLDNRRVNLRECNKSINAFNTDLRVSNLSGVTGVCWSENACKWRAIIYINRKRIHLGYFKNFKNAVRVRKKAEKKYFGEFTPAK